MSVCFEMYIARRISAKEVRCTEEKLGKGKLCNCFSYAHAAAGGGRGEEKWEKSLLLTTASSSIPPGFTVKVSFFLDRHKGFQRSRGRRREKSIKPNGEKTNKSRRPSSSQS